MARPVTKKRFFDGGLNGDSFLTVKESEFVNGQNIRFGSSDKGADDRIESIGGTTLVWNNPVGSPPNNLMIGSCEDEARSRVLFFNWNAGGQHGIYCLDKSAGLVYTVLLSADVTGGLNFSKESYIHSCFFINNNLYWVDGTNNQPRRLNTEAGIKAYQPSYNTSVVAYTLPVSQSVISWIRRQPGLPPTQVKLVDSGFNGNFVEFGAFKFCYRYQYRDYELSTLSAYSNLANYNDNNDIISNYIAVKIPFGEQVDQDVLEVDLVVISLPDNTYFAIKSWNKNNAADAAAIAAHNSGSTQLNYSFYNNISGITLDSAYSVKPYDVVPLFSQTTELAKDRTFLAGNTLGYTAPLVTSLSYNLNTVHIEATLYNMVIGTFYLYNSVTGYSPQPTCDLYVIQTFFPIFGTEPVASNYYYGYYIPPFPGTTTPPFPYPTNSKNFVPAIINSEDIAPTLGLTFIGTTLSDISNFYVPTPYHPVSSENLILQTEPLPGGGAGAAFVSININGNKNTNYEGLGLKSQSLYQLAVTFYDNDGRKCGSVTNESLLLSTPVVSKVSGNIVGSVGWTLSNSSSAIEIPRWASYYSVDITKCLRTRFFVQGIGNMIYASKDENGVYYFNNSINISSAYPAIVGVALDISGLTGFGIGYTYTSGDICILNINNVFHTLQITAQIGSYIILELENLGTLSQSSIVVTGTLSASLVNGNVSGTVSAVGNVSGTGSFTGIVTSGTSVTGTVSGIFGNNTATNNLVTGTITDINGKIATLSGNLSFINNNSNRIGNPGTAYFEIYTPYKQSASEPYYETGTIYPVNNPGTSNPQYSTTSDAIRGDTYFISRRMNMQIQGFYECMSPNDKFWKIWNTDAGRPNFVDPIGQTVSTNGGSFSNTIIPGTRTNGLSTYDALNVFTVPLENGPIQRLKLAQKVEDKGTIMLCICVRETCSIYIGEVQVTDTTGNTFLATSDGIVGTINALKGSLGTLHPESVFEFNGLVFWYDMINGCFVQYANNGLDPVSRFGLKKQTELFSLALSQLTPTQIEQLGSRPFVIGGVDPYHKEATWTIPATSAVPVNGYLPDYGSPYVANPYQLYDGRGGTWAFKFEKNQWMGDRTYQAEGFCRSANDLFSWKAGSMYKHNDPTPTNQNTFYGVFSPSRLIFLENTSPEIIKTFENMGIKGNLAPSWTHFETLYPYIQCSDLFLPEWKFREGDWYATVLRDRLSPNISGSFDQKVLTGDKLRANSMLCLLEFSPTLQQLFVNFVYTGFLQSIGHTP